MKSWVWQSLLVGTLIFGGQNAKASGVSMADWCVNLNGDVNSACNGAGSGGNGIDTSAFDQTLEPSTNTLGSVTVTLTTGTNNVAFYADYDVDYPTDGSFQDFATTSGSLGAGQHFQVDDPNVNNLFGAFSGFTLNDTNALPQGSFAGPPDTPCCDVSFAMSFSGLTVAAGGSGTVTFTVSDSSPEMGFIISQVNGNSGNRIYLSANVDIQNPSGGSAPEPSTFGMGLLGAGAGFAAWKRRRVA